MVNLSAHDLAAIGRRIPVPEYDRRAVTTGIVHFGVGAFHRSHEAMYLDRLLRLDDDNAQWGICGVGVLPADVRMRDALAAQDGLYSLVVKHPDGESEARVIGSITEYLFAPDDPLAVIEKLCDPAVRIVSLTITEGGYRVNDATGEFDATDAGTVADLVVGTVPSTTFGFITDGLRRRRERGIAPFTVMSCDNIQGNGHTARVAVTAFARLKDPELGEWIADTVAFPNSMVDRITPATTPAAIAEVSERYGVDDAWPVVSEAFEQWVLEDDFPAGRPAFEKVGVQLVDDVAPYEMMKLRLLNASHQAMSYLGILAGFTFVHDTVRDQLFADFLRSYMRTEAVPTLQPVPGIDLVAYCEELIQRFSSTAIADTLARQVVDGSERIPKFLLPVVHDQLAGNGAVDHAALVLAAWSEFLHRSHEGSIDITDGRAELLVDAIAKESTVPGALLDVTEVFGELGRDVRLREAYVSARADIGLLGPRSAMNKVLLDHRHSAP